jgi:hypothetical protein
MHQIRYFLAVSEYLNFRRAAEQCHVSGPALTRAIQKLEEELGGKLFRRERNLTPVLRSSATPDVLSIQNLMTVKKRSGLSSEKRVSRAPADKASPKATGRIQMIL